MAYQFDISGLTLNMEESQQVSEAVFEYVLEVSDIAEYHDVHTGIQWETQIPFIGVLGLVGKKILACKPDANGSTIPLSEKKWTPQLIGDRFEHCSVEADPLLKLFKKVKNINPDFYDRINSEELGIVLMRISEAMREMLHRIIWFGDLAADEVSQGGVLTNGTDILFFTMLDGLWKQIISLDIPTTSKYYIKIAANDGVDYDAQQTLASDYAYTLFKSMWKASDARFKQLVQKGTIVPVIHVTSGIAENWQDYKEDKSVGFTLQNIEEGGLKEMFRKLEIITRYDWDAVIQAYQDNAVTWNLPNRALMTVKGNIPIGTVNTSDLDKVKSFYDDYNEVNVMDFRLKLDAKFLEDYLAVAAY